MVLWIWCSRRQDHSCKEYASLFGNLSPDTWKKMEKGNIWFVHEKMVGVVDYSEAKPVIYYIPELKKIKY